MATQNVMSTISPQNHTNFVSNILVHTGTEYTFSFYHDDYPEDGGEYTLVNAPNTVVVSTCDGWLQVSGMFVDDGHLVLVLQDNDGLECVSPTYDKYPKCDAHEVYYLTRVSE